MPLPADFYVPTRQDLIDQHVRDVKIRQPGAPTWPGSLADLDARNIADHLLPVYANSVRTFHNTNLADADFTALQAKAVAKGLPALLPASGGTGHVAAVATSGGVFIAGGAIIKDDKTNLRFQCTNGKTYVDQEAVPIAGIDTGPTTNLASGLALRWESPPPGLGELAIILANPNGDGLIGGSDAENPEQLRQRIADADADQAEAANAASIRKLAKDAATVFGIPMEEVFVYSAISGPNTYGVAFTVRPARSGGSRTPSDVQNAQVLAYITGILPHGDGIFTVVVLPSPVELLLQAKWASGATGWTDLTQYPQYNAGSPAAVTAATSATAFQVSSVDVPQVGQTIAFYSAAASVPVFVRKKILTVSGAGPYDLTIDVSLNVSDLAYVPTVGEKFCPWSDSLALLLVVLGHFDTIGPGEQFSAVNLFDPGERLRRNPPPPAWPNQLTHRVTNLLDPIAALADVSVLSPTLPLVTPTGTPAVSANLLTCGRVLAFP
jgi:uncharacterized phage protein gp47/JayE